MAAAVLAWTPKARKCLNLLGPATMDIDRWTLRWWNRGESNPRPQAIAGRFYMRSWLI